MSSVVLNVFKNQRIDITAQMKDADEILKIFKEHHVKFDKKFTSMNFKGPSTITFKGMKATNTHNDLTNVIVAIHKLAQEDTIGNVYVRFTSFNKTKKKEETTEQEVTDACVVSDAILQELTDPTP